MLEGDLIVLLDSGTSTRGFVTADSASGACGVQRHEQGSGEPSLEYDNFVFQVFPGLSYRAKQELKELSAPTGGGRGGGRRRSISVGEDHNEEVLLAERARNEDRLNEATLDAVEAGTRRELLRFGQTVQLRHLKSGLFLCVRQSAALKDSSCREVVLGEGSMAAQLRLLPRFKIQTEGSAACYSHSVKFESIVLPGMHLHTSTKALEEDHALGMGSSLPRCLATPPCLELNAGAKFSTYLLRKFASFGEGQSTLLQTGLSPFRLYHPVSEAFVLASCDAEKNETSPEPRPLWLASGRGKDELRGPGAAVGSLPAHIPYLKTLTVPGGDEDASDPTDRRNHSCKGIWVFEALHRGKSQVVHWGDAVRLRHMPSGKYLCVDSAKGPIQRKLRSGAAAPTTFYSGRMVDDAASGLGEHVGDGRFADDAESLVFFVETDGQVDGNGAVPLSDVSIRLEHRRRVYDEGGDSEQDLTLHLHCSEFLKPKASPAAESRSFLVLFSTERSAQDGLSLMPVLSEENRLVQRAKSFIPHALRFARRLSDPSFPEPAPDKLGGICKFLLDIIGLQSRGNTDMDPTISWVARANSFLPAEFSALFDSEPDDRHQNVSRDVKLMDAVFSMSMAPYIRTFPQKPFPQAFKKLKLEMKGRGPVPMEGPRGVQKLVRANWPCLFVSSSEMCAKILTFTCACVAALLGACRSPAYVRRQHCLSKLLWKTFVDQLRRRLAALDGLHQIAARRSPRHGSDVVETPQLERGTTCRARDASAGYGICEDDSRFGATATSC